MSAEEFLDALRSEDAPRALEELLHKARGLAPTHWPYPAGLEPERERKPQVREH